MSNNALRMMWNLSPDQRLEEWHNFRISLQDQYSQTKNQVDVLNQINDWWDSIPLVNLTIDPDNISTWPTLWDIIYQGEGCLYGKGLAKAYSIHYVLQDHEASICSVLDRKNAKEYCLAVCDNYYVLNVAPGSLFKFDDLLEGVEILFQYNIDEIINKGNKI